MYQKELKYLFEVYTEKNWSSFSGFLMRLYAGIENLQRSITEEERGKQMKTAVIYHSQTGFTKRYAQWTAEAVKADCLNCQKPGKKICPGMKQLCCGSWVCAGSLSKFGWFKSNMDKWKDKKLAVFCVGASPADNPEVQDFLKQNFGGPEFAGVRVFYCPGGFCYEKMGMKSKLMMKVFMKALKAKKEKTEAEKEMVRWISSSYDISDRKYIEPVLNI